MGSVSVSQDDGTELVMIGDVNYSPAEYYSYDGRFASKHNGLLVYNEDFEVETEYYFIESKDSIKYIEAKEVSQYDKDLLNDLMIEKFKEGDL